MRKTIDILYECCMMDVIPPVSVIHDYFNINNNNNDDNLSMILGLYQGMFKCRNMKKSTVEKAFKKNELDKLIHVSYKLYIAQGSRSGYYKEFCDKKFSIGETYIK
jgi:predicted nucleic-acid-binding Zn-ribbon protein